MSEDKRCPYCGETDALPRHICLIRQMQAMGSSPAPFPCSYSVEGCERIEQSLADSADESCGATAQAEVVP